MPNNIVFNPNAQNLKTQIFGQDGADNIVPFEVSQYGNLLTTLINSNGQSSGLPLSAFYDLRTAEITPVTGWSFNYNINSDLIQTTLTGSGIAAQSNGKAVLTVPAAGSSSKIETIKALRYIPGLGGLARFTAIFTTGVANSTQIMGLGDSNDGFFFGFNGETFSVLRRQNGGDNWIAQSSWNIDRFDGGGASGIMLDPTKGNVYFIQFQWLGFGDINFFIVNPQTGDPILVHRIQYSNANTNPSVFNPTFPLMAQVINTTNDSTLTLQTSSAMAFTEGFDSTQAISTRNSASGSKTGITAEVPILSILNKSTFQSKTNRVRILLDFLSLGSNSGSKPAHFSIIRNATLTGYSFQDVSGNTSVVQYDTSATALSGGTRVLEFDIGGIDNKELFLSSLNLQLSPNSKFTISASSGNTINIDTSVSWQELW